MPFAATQIAAPETTLKPSELFSSPGKRTFILSLALVLLTVLAYLPVRNNAFINFDDNHYITQNSQVKAGLSWDTLKWAFTTYDAANWHPLTWLSHALDSQLFGMNSAGPHSISVLLHALNAVLLFLILQSLTGFTWRSLMVAALFAVHPLNVESVAWAAERKTVLSMLFFLLAISAYFRYVHQPTKSRYLGVVGLFALALMSKPQVITFPLALLLLDYWPSGRTRFAAPLASTDSSAEVGRRPLTSLLVEKIPLLGLSAISAIITLQAQHAGHAVRTVVEYSLASRVETAVLSYALYVRDAFVPWHLAPIYPHADGLLATWKVLLAATVLIAISALAVLGRRRAPYLLFGWLWFVGSLVPMIGLIQVGEQARADRYMYVSLIGMLVAVIWGGADLLVRRKFSPAVGAAVCGVVLVALSVATFQQIGHWRDSETLWNYTLAVTGQNFMAEDNLAQELAHQGRTKEALVHFHNVLKLHDWQPSELIAFGMYEQRQGYSSDAIAQYQRALQNTSDPKTRAVELSNIGSAYMDMKDLQNAQVNFSKALQADPNNVPALIGAGIIAQKNGALTLAIAQYTRAVSIAPTDWGYALLARALEQSGRTSDANTAYAQAQKLSPNMQSTLSTADHFLAN
jgi:tetratricopeptide (TPR) repeat protein